MVYILGCDHYLQDYDLQDYTQEIRKVERALKERFYSIIEEIIRAQTITFVGEECKPAQETIPRALAAELGCKYVEIDMASEEREKRGIAKNYDELGNDEQKRCYELREDYMVERTYVESTVEAPKLIVCGALHIDGLARRFREREEEVVTRNLLTKKWCVLPLDLMMRGAL
jgi:hypothetical protein